MELSRRDAIAALAATGAAVGGVGFALSREDSGDETPLGGEAVTTLVAGAEVLYPSAVDNVEPFVRRYARGRAEDRPEHARAIGDAVAYLDAYTQAWYDEPFAALAPPEREEALERMGADAADPVPDGSDVERVRYYVINELLLALYASPTGGELIGLENPQGHAGGLGSYQQAPR